MDWGVTWGLWEQVVVLDIRFPTLPVAELQRHQASVNALAWAPHSSCHICTAGDDAQALIWDLSSMGKPLESGLGAFPSGGISPRGCMPKDTWVACLRMMSALPRWSSPTSGYG